MRRGLFVLVAMALLSALVPRTAAAQETSCVTCHADPELFDPDWVAIVEGYALGAHAEVGISCHDCHGGNPDPALFEDTIAAMDPDWSGNPYQGVPDTDEIPARCASCHSDADTMRDYRPDIRVDQLAEYRTSRHGRLLAAGDEQVATCVSCHGSHEIRRPTDPLSSVHPTRVASTCAACHSDPELMDGRTLPDGRPVPIDQHARWSQSVHADALLVREDLSAPTCNDCHGNHGATPPGLASINFVCGQCHGREATLFRESSKRDGFVAHNEYLLDAGEERCAACHFEPEAPATVTGVGFLGECASCHGNHGIVRPTVAMLSPLPDTPCYFCHEGPEAAIGEAHEVEATADHYTARKTALLEEASGLGLEGDRRFDWLVERAGELPVHGTVTESGVVVGEEFSRLFEKFRIGKTAYEYLHPATGETVRAEVPRCADCHSTTEAWGEDAIGLATSRTLLERMSTLTARTAAAERALLRARRGGVATGAAGGEVQAAVDAQIAAEVLVHRFAVGEESEFGQQVDTGLAHASAAMAAGRAALDELVDRRRGLVVALVLILLVLVALALKIRDLPTAD